MKLSFFKEVRRKTPILFGAFVLLATLAFVIPGAFAADGDVTFSAPEITSATQMTVTITTINDDVNTIEAVDVSFAGFGIDADDDDVIAAGERATAVNITDCTGKAGGVKICNLVFTFALDFSDTATEYDAAHGLSVADNAVNFAGGLTIGADISDAVAQDSTAIDDGQNPTIVSITTDTNPIDLGDLTQLVTVTYDEPMDPGFTPVITSNNANFGAPAGGAWGVGNTVYTATLTHDGTAEEIGTSTVSVAAGATDVAGNAEAAGDESATFDVDTVVPTVTGVTGAFGGTAATVTFSENVYSANNGTGALDATDLTYNNVSADGAASISSFTHVAGASTGTLALNANLISRDSNDTLKDAAASVYDLAGNAGISVTTANMVVTGVDNSFILKNGWNAFSTPRKLSSLTFSNGGTNITYWGLNAGTWASVIANTTNVAPLEGFLVNNTTGGDVTVDLVYQTGLAPSAKLYSKQLDQGWNLIGIAAPDDAATNNGTNTVNVGDGANVIDPLKDEVSQLIDFTGEGDTPATAVGFTVGADKGSPRLTTGNWVVKIKSYFSGATGDFANGKSYGAYITEDNTSWSGTQN